MKEEIIKTRVGGLGSSDAKMVASVGRTGKLNQTARKRIAEMLNLVERKEFSTRATEAGNEIEQAIFQAVHDVDSRAISNPYFKSENLSEMYGFDIFNHIDIELITDEKVIWYEIKATIHTPEQTIDQYIDQLAWHQALLNEKARKEGKEPVLILAHYDTSAGVAEFHPDKLTVKRISKEILRQSAKEINDGLGIIYESLPGFEYLPDSVGNLPAETHEYIDKINYLLRVAKEAEDKAEEFKERLKFEMEKYNIRTIDNEYFHCTFVPDTVQSRFDSNSLKKEDPETYSKYLKNSSMKSSIRIKLK